MTEPSRPLEPTSALSPDAGVEIRLSPRSVRRTLLTIVVGLTLAGVVAQVLKHPLEITQGRGAVQLFDSDAEANVPTWYSSLTLLACSLLAGAIALSAQRARKQYRGHWTTLSIVFFLAALDESASLHELGNAWLFEALDTGGLLRAIWVVPGMLFVLMLAIVYRPFVADLPERVRRLVTRGALAFVVGALALETVEGAIDDARGGEGSFADGLVGVAQEFLEMLGVILFIEALMTHMETRGTSIRMGFGTASRPSRA